MLILHWSFWICIAFVVHDDISWQKYIRLIVAMWADMKYDEIFGYSIALDAVQLWKLKETVVYCSIA